MAASPWLMSSPANAQHTNGSTTMTQVQIQLADRTIVIDLEDTPSSRDLLTLLPLSLVLEDYAATEKIAYPPRKLITTGAPAGVQPKAGDLAYYAPWGNLAFFHRDFRYSAGLIRLGRLRGGLDLLARSGQLNARLVAVAAGPAASR